jgi:hypothetical protein
MKKLITLALSVLLSGILYSQNIEIIEDDKFTYESNNQSFVSF